MGDVASSSRPTLSTRTVLFCDIGASTQLRQRVGDVTADSWFAELAQRWSAAIDHAGGSVLKWLGDGAMAVFPAAGSAIDAGVEIQRIADIYHRGEETILLGEHPRTRVGISTGDVAETDGDCNGMPVIEAARLCDAAAPDEILIADAVRMMAGTRCAHRMSAPSSKILKGIADPVVAVRVLWDRVGTTRSMPFPRPLAAARRSTLAGRSAMVTDLVQRFNDRRWQAVLIGGEPGIGKTRLVAELTYRLHTGGVSVLLGRCDAELGVMYRPWADALTPLIEALPQTTLDVLAPMHAAGLVLLIPALAQRLPTALSAAMVDAEGRHDLVVEAIVAIVGDVGNVGPITIVFDDLHWADTRSLQAIRQVLEQGNPDVSIVGTYRDTEVGPHHRLTALLADMRRMDGVHRLVLTGLDRAAVGQIVELAVGHALDDAGRELADAVQGRTAGNPLFVAELIRHLADSGVGTVGGARGSRAMLTVAHADMALPDGLRDVIGRRLYALGERTCATLRIAATAGHIFDLDVIDAAAVADHGAFESTSGEHDDVLDHVEAAAAAGIVVDTGQGFEFRHAVIRDVLLAEMSGARRQRLHRQLAAVLEQRWATRLDSHLEELTFHHVQGRTSAAPTWTLRAARACTAALDGNAVVHADRGLALLDELAIDDPALRCDLLIARVCGLRFNQPDTLAEAEEAFAAALALGDETRMGEALLTINTGSLVHSQPENSAFLARGIALLTDTTLVTRWKAEAGLVVREYLDNGDDASAHVGRVAAIVDHLDPRDTQSCQIAMRLARSLTSTSWPRSALEIVERFSENCAGVDTEGLPVDLAMSVMWIHLGDRDASARHFDVVRSDPRRADWYLDSMVSQCESMGHMLDGNWGLAAAATARTAERGGHDLNFALVEQAQQSWLLIETGQLDAALRELMNLSATLPDLMVLRAAQAFVLAEIGDDSAARALLDELAPNRFEAAGRGWMTLLSLTNVATAIIAVDAHHHAPVLRELLHPYAGQIAVMVTGTHAVCAVDRLLAGLAAVDGDHEVADHLFAQALRQEQALRSPPLVARTRHWWARALIRQGHGARAAPLLEEALVTARQLAMTGLVRQIEQLRASL